MTLAAIICSGITAHAEDKKANDQAPQSAVNIAFGRYGFHSDPKVSTTGCNVLMNLDQKTSLETFQEIHNRGPTNERLYISKVINQIHYRLHFCFKCCLPPQKLYIRKTQTTISAHLSKQSQFLTIMGITRQFSLFPTILQERSIEK
jgi:hypothetical protein